ncbi:MAG: DUF1566 domain-containing protein [Actinobacteria bacterium]|uniref:Unannotated protein n=1 Tax=freshwater metagenome TaxID=449393 RepID=A0A6J7RZ04_9ZZZZ|nr:DUF1566 domain-containing protein [Actinomycetota bacterium]
MNINGRVKVKTLKAQFFEEFGLTIRVYDGRSFADDNATLASIRRGESIGGEFSPRKNTKVGNLEDKIKELFGLKTQIAGSDNSYLCDNNMTLAKAKEDDDARIIQKTKKADKVSNSGTEKTSGSIVIKEMSFKGELSNKAFNQILFWNEGDALSDIESFESTTDLYSVIFNSPVLGNCDNLEEFYENESEFWQNIEEYKDKYGINENRLWELITNSYCSMLAKNYIYRDVGEFEINDIDLSPNIELFIKLLVNKELKYDDHPEILGLTIANSFVQSYEETELDVELFNFDEGPEFITITDYKHLFPNRPATQEISINEFNINDICLLFSQSSNGAAFIEDILDYINNNFESEIEIEIEIEIEDVVNYLKTKSENLDFTRIIKESKVDFYEWVSSCNSANETQNFAKILKIHKLIIEKEGKLFYFSSDKIIVENAERKSMRDIINLMCNDEITLDQIAGIYDTENDTQVLLNQQNIVLIDRDFFDNNDGTVTDKITKLTWQRFSVGQQWDGVSCIGEAVKIDWAQAMELQTDFGGYSDWRLPSVEELESLYYSPNGKYNIRLNGEYGSPDQIEPPTINSEYFPNTPSGIFWSSHSASTVGDGGVYARSVDFSKGESRKNTKTYGNYVRLVRG